MVGWATMQTKGGQKLRVSSSSGHQHHSLRSQQQSANWPSSPHPELLWPVPPWSHGNPLEIHLIGVTPTIYPLKTSSKLEHKVKYMVGTQYYLINKVINEFSLTLPLPQTSSGLEVTWLAKELTKVKGLGMSPCLPWYHTVFKHGHSYISTPGLQLWRVSRCRSVFKEEPKIKDMYVTYVKSFFPYLSLLSIPVTSKSIVHTCSNLFLLYTVTTADFQQRFIEFWHMWVMVLGSGDTMMD